MNEKVEMSKNKRWEYRIVKIKNTYGKAITPIGLEDVPYFYNICMVIFEDEKIKVIDRNPLQLSSTENNMEYFINIINEVKKLPVIDAETFDLV